MGSGVIFKSLIHFEFIFVYGVRKWSSFIPLHVAVLFSQHHLYITSSLSVHLLMSTWVASISWLL